MRLGARTTPGTSIAPRWLIARRVRRDRGGHVARRHRQRYRDLGTRSGCLYRDCRAEGYAGQRAYPAVTKRGWHVGAMARPSATSRSATYSTPPTFIIRQVDITPDSSGTWSSLQTAGLMMGNKFTGFGSLCMASAESLRRSSGACRDPDQRPRCAVDGPHA